MRVRKHDKIDCIAQSEAKQLPAFWQGQEGFISVGTKPVVIKVVTTPNMITGYNQQVGGQLELEGVKCDMHDGLIGKLTRCALVVSVIGHLRSGEGVVAAKNNRWKGGVMSE